MSHPSQTQAYRFPVPSAVICESRTIEIFLHLREANSEANCRRFKPEEVSAYRFSADCGGKNRRRAQLLLRRLEKTESPLGGSCKGRTKSQRQHLSDLDLGNQQIMLKA